MRHFTKMLKLAQKAHKHAYMNSAKNHKRETADLWKYDGMSLAIKREHATGSSKHVSRFPKKQNIRTMRDYNPYK